MRTNTNSWASGPTSQFDRIPSTRESFTWNRLSVTVGEMRQNRIVKLICRVLPEPDADKEGGEAK